MTWYPDWVVALDDTAKGKPNANVTPRNAQDAIRAIQQLTEERDRLRRAAGAYLATTEGLAVTFREGLTRAELAAAVEGKP